MLVIAVAFTSKAESNGAGIDNGVTYDIVYDLPISAEAIVDNATAPVNPFSNVTVVTVNYKNVGGFDVDVPSNSIVAEININTITDNYNKGFAETVSDLNSIKTSGIGFATNTETVSDSLYPDNVNISPTNSTKYTNERIKTNVGKLKTNI